MARILHTNQITVNTSPTLISDSKTGRDRITLISHGVLDVYIGNSSVTANTGSLLANTKGLGRTINTATPVYGIVASGNTIVSFEETY